MIRAFAYVISFAYLALGLTMGLSAYVDITRGVYPWADHIPALCVCVGAVAAYFNAVGFHLVFATKLEG